jgi:glycosyltransferase involved in cell wall biosynthesis
MTDISIVIPVKNSVGTVRRCIESVLSQENILIECIVMDAISNDGTSEILSSYGNLIKHVRESDLGIADAMNKGILLARSSLIAILDADDYYLPNVLMKIVEIHQSSPTSIICCDMRIVGDRINYVNMPRGFRRLEYGMVINHTAAFTPRECFINFGLYNTKYKLIADLDFYRRVFRAGYKFSRANICSTVYATGGTTHSASNMLNQEMIEFIQSSKISQTHKNFILLKRKYLYKLFSSKLTYYSHIKNLISNYLHF